MASGPEERPETDPPLWSIGFAVANGTSKVPLAHPLLHERAKFDGTCLLDSKDPLMVVERPSDRSDGLVLVKVQGKTAIEWPFCPPQAEVLIALPQVMQQSDLWAETKARLSKWFRW